MPSNLIIPIAYTLILAIVVFAYKQGGRAERLGAIWFGANMVVSAAVAARAPRLTPWKALVKATIELRPVTLRASLRAASTAFVPVGPVNCTL